MHCFRSAIKATKEELAGRGAKLLVDRIDIDCTFDSAGTTRCMQCNDRGDICGP